MRAIDADALIADCQLAQKQADRHGREFANAFYSGGGEISTEWWCVEDMIENASTIDPKIIRCKDCQFYRNIMNGGTPYEYGVCELNPKPTMSPEFYCSFAERRSDD